MHGSSATPLAGLISVASDREDVDVIYVNDNYGDVVLWGSQGREAPADRIDESESRSCVMGDLDIEL